MRAILKYLFLLSLSSHQIKQMNSALAEAIRSAVAMQNVF